MKLRTASMLSRYQTDASDVGGESYGHSYVHGKAMLQFHVFLT
jgi:hypothetical protein